MTTDIDERLRDLGIELPRVFPPAGNYVSVALSFTCPSREKYDAAHAALRADPDVRWTL